MFRLSGRRQCRDAAYITRVGAHSADSQNEAGTLRLAHRAKMSNNVEAIRLP
jgi:hypothetical protein